MHTHTHTQSNTAAEEEAARLAAIEMEEEEEEITNQIHDNQDLSPYELSLYTEEQRKKR